MASSNQTGESRLPVILKDVDKDYKKPERRNDLVNGERYDVLDEVSASLVKLGTNGVAYVSEEAIPKYLQLTKAAAAYVYENQLPESDKRNFGESSFVHSAAVVGLLDKKAQETRNSDVQALLQYSRDSLLNISDSAQAQDLRRKCDTHISRELPKLRRQRGVEVDELTGEPLGPKAAFHHVNPKNIHTDPEDSINPTKGRNLNSDSHNEIHKNNINDEKQFEEYKARRKK